MKKGLSLVEIIVSTVILSIVVAALAGLFVMGKRYILHSRSRLTSGQMVRYFLDPLQMDVNQSQWGSNCLSDPSGCTASALDFGDGVTYTPTFKTGDITITGGGLRYVNLTINWTEISPES